MKFIPGKVLFLAASGIGNTILATPLIQRARQIWPDAQIDLLTSRRIFQAQLSRSTIIQNFFNLERNAISTLWNLRRKQYDISINCFPSNRWQFNVVAGIIGAQLRVTHVYAEGNRMSRLLNHLVPADESLHDIEQNLRLLDLISGEKNLPVSPLVFALNSEDEKHADEWLVEQKLQNSPLVGVHVGGVNATKNSWLMNRSLGSVKAPRREDLRRDMADLPADSAILFFGGTEENLAIQTFRESLPIAIQTRCYRYLGDLWTTAALVRRCNFFVSGDTALMHIAAVFGVPQKAYFMTTNPRRTAPRNPKAELIIEKGCATYRYPFTIGRKSQ